MFVPLFLTAILLSGCGSPSPSRPAPISGQGIEEPGEATQRQAPPVKSSTRPAQLPPMQGEFTPLAFRDLEGWQEDQQAQALLAWVRGCRAMAAKGEPFASLCEEARQLLNQRPADAEARAFFEQHFQPFRLRDPKAAGSGSSGQQGTITGYYEPVLMGSRRPSSQFSVPFYRTPPDLVTVDLNGLYPELRALRLRGRLVKGPEGERLLPYPSRGELERSSALRGLEIAYTEDPVEAFFLQVQGSGKLQLEDGSQLRLGYANQNGHPYKSIGAWLVEKGELTLGQASAQGIKAWLAANPSRRDELLHQNPSMVFFKELPATADPTEGPIGSLGVPLTGGRSLAVDPRFVALGLPVFLKTSLPSGPTARLVMAQDTGSAIRGVHRGDFFFGSGRASGEEAGRMKARGEMVVLLPKALAR